MPGLVGQKREQVIVKGCFVNAQVLTDVFRLEYPLVGVVNLVPFVITAQVILVCTFKIVPVNKVVRGDGPCRYRVIIELLLFKKDANSSERRVPSAVS